MFLQISKIICNICLETLCKFDDFRKPLKLKASLDYREYIRRRLTNFCVFAEKGYHFHTNWLSKATNLREIREKGCQFCSFWLPQPKAACKIAMSADAGAAFREAFS